mmetsp:Transcript_18810/g.60040  ORF Transcript_18810/g.60040 Transcript_18810/m.60040 type:complete len:949 (+) Transcript_18810:83-2929(+)
MAEPADEAAAESVRTSSRQGVSDAEARSQLGPSEAEQPPASLPLSDHAGLQDGKDTVEQAASADGSSPTDVPTHRSSCAPPQHESGASPASTMSAGQRKSSLSQDPLAEIGESTTANAVAAGHDEITRPEVSESDASSGLHGATTHPDLAMAQAGSRRPSLVSTTSGEPEKRPSLVSSTELLQSPGGTRKVSVGLRRNTDDSAPGSQTSGSAPSGTPKGAAEKGSTTVHHDAQALAEPRHDFLSGLDGDDVFGQAAQQPSRASSWRHSADDVASEAEEYLAAQLAADMAREQARDNLDEDDEYYARPAHRPARSDAERQDMELRESNAGNSNTATADFTHDLLAEKDKQIESLQEQLMQAIRGDAGVVSGIDPNVCVDQRDAKIVALAKKNRTLTLAFERERDKAASMTKRVAELEAAMSQAAGQLALENDRTRTSVQSRSAANFDDVEQLKRELQGQFSDRLNEAQSKADDLRRKLDRASTESKRLKRVLAREVGEGPTLDKILADIQHSQSAADGADDAGSWRGRAQKIVLLQAKLKRAYSQLEQMHAVDRSQSGDIGAEEYGFGGEEEDYDLLGSPSRGPRRPRKKKGVDSKAEEDIRSIEQERRHAMERLAEEYEQLESQLAERKRTMSAIKARSTVLENENKRYKEQLKVLLNKTKNDDALVDALRREVDRLKREVGEYRDRAKLLETDTMSTAAYDELKQHALSQGTQIERQGQLLVKMRSELERVKATASRELVDKAHEEMDTQAHAVNNKLLQVENERLGELVELFKKKLERAVLDREATLTKCKTLERSKIELERKLGNIKAGGRKRQPMADQFSELRDKLALAIEENRALKASSAQALTQKDEEIKILREMGVQVKNTYERAISDMKRQVASTAVEAQKRILSTDSRVDDALLSQLTRDNEFLREELQDIRGRNVGQQRGSPSHHAKHRYASPRGAQY